MNLPDLLAPITAERPCGEDLSYSPEVLELDALVAGKPETQFSAAEEPDWKIVQEKALALFARTRDLRVAAALTLARLALGGLEGFGEGVELIGGLLERHWSDLYPLLEDGDALERVNIVAALSTPEGTFGDPFGFIRRLRRVPLCHSPQLGALSLADLQGTSDAGEGAVERGLAEATFRDTPSATLVANAAAVARAQAGVAAIDRLLTERVGAGQAANFEALERTLRDAGRALAPHVATAPSGDPQQPADAARPVEAGASERPAAVASGPIRSRQDVLAALGAVCHYYEEVEPSSPLLPLLRRCEGLVGKGFLDLLQELVPDGAPRLKIGE